MISNFVTNTIMEDRISEYNDNLELYLKKAGQLFDLPRIINEPQGKQQIINYYMTNKLTYRFLNSWKGLHALVGLVTMANTKEKISRNKQK